MRNSTIQLNDDHKNICVEVQCSKVGSKNRLIHTTFDTDNIMSIITTSFSKNAGDGISLLICTVSFRAEQLSRNESSLINILCLNSEVGVQANKRFQIHGKCANEYDTYSIIQSCP